MVGGRHGHDHVVRKPELPGSAGDGRGLGSTGPALPRFLGESSQEEIPVYAALEDRDTKFHAPLDYFAPVPPDLAGQFGRS
jgi:hypothetical protein